MSQNTQSHITLDKTQISIVVLCTACPWWRGFALDRIEGWTVGANHQRMFHPETQQAEKALLNARKSRQKSTVTALGASE